ncbi:HepT-like ribonuclease domain-containing protein [Sulfurospirillum sp. MES]|uniref:HepT-like ribonuclease domain-containing protein n=1 Tax=Sulfurospirillum sp. MES TaxID=1565314 RepID=UPI000543A86A|nr:HepT-like ribonuclease domain-containing protein [Sulfurospirillum sp. MES]KHG34398.1 MAG: antitoxin [Sulfurospirillum sp. MES]
MSDRTLMVLSTLEDIDMSIDMVIERFKAIKTADDFLSSAENIEKLDSIAMRLLAIGEGLKNIDKLTDGQLLPRYPSIEWKNIKGLRDVLSHHYFDINAEILFDVCSSKLGELSSVVKLMSKDLKV